MSIPGDGSVEDTALATLLYSRNLFSKDIPKSTTPELTCFTTLPASFVTDWNGGDS